VTRASRTTLVVGAGLALATWFGALRVRLNYDEGVYAQTLRLVAHGHALISDVFSSQPPLWPYLALPGWLGGGVTGARLWIMCWSLLGLVAVYAVARVYTSPALSLLTAVLAAAVPVFTTDAAAIEADIPSLALATAAVALALRPGRSTGRLVIAGLLLGAGLMVKLLVLPMVVVVLLAAVLTAPDRRHVVRDLAVVAVASAAVIAVTGVVFWSNGQLWDQTVGFHVDSQSLVSGVRKNISTALLSPGTCVFLLLAGLAGVDVAYRRRRDQLLPVVWLAATAGFLLLHSPLFTHHLVLAVPPAALVLVLALEARLAARPGLLQVSLAGLVAACLIGSAADDITAPPRDNARNNAAVAALERLPQSTVLVTDDQVLATAAGRSVVGPLVDTSDVRISSGSLTPGEVCAQIAHAGAVLLTRGGRFALLPEIGRCTRRDLQVGWSDADATLFVRR
jgi:4-amino-4-deoxy-L-arabinose transferase-like glycosyltransferase